MSFSPPDPGESINEALRAIIRMDSIIALSETYRLHPSSENVAMMEGEEGRSATHDNAETDDNTIEDAATVTYPPMKGLHAGKRRKFARNELHKYTMAHMYNIARPTIFIDEEKEKMKSFLPFLEKLEQTLEKARWHNAWFEQMDIQTQEARTKATKAEQMLIASQDKLIASDKKVADLMLDQNSIMESILNIEDRERDLAQLLKMIQGVEKLIGNKLVRLDKVLEDLRQLPEDTRKLADELIGEAGSFRDVVSRNNKGISILGDHIAERQKKTMDQQLELDKRETELDHGINQVNIALQRLAMDGNYEFDVANFPDLWGCKKTVASQKLKELEARGRVLGEDAVRIDGEHQFDYRWVGIFEDQRAMECN